MYGDRSAATVADGGEDATGAAARPAGGPLSCDTSASPSRAATPALRTVGILAPAAAGGPVVRSGRGAGDDVGGAEHAHAVGGEADARARAPLLGAGDEQRAGGVGLLDHVVGAGGG